jgi:hypothetical protein
MKDKVLFIGLPLALLVVFLMHWTSIKMYGMPDKTEAFADVPNLNSCPDDLTRYTDGKAINCCEGEVKGGRCSGLPRCSLSGTGNLPRCADYLRATGLDKATRFCPKSMPNYYSADGKGRCTNSAIKSDGSGPVEKNNKYCEIYKTPEENTNYPRSCYNQRRLDEFKVTITQKPVRKEVQSQGKNMPAFLYAIWQDGLKMKFCADRSSFETYLDVAMSGWRSGNNALYNDMIKREGTIDYCN